MTTLEPPKIELYTPPGSVTLDQVEQPQQRIGIQGFPGTGKTHVSLTWPNPITANIDKGLGAHFGRTDVKELKFWDPKWVREFTGRDNIKDGLEHWIDTVAPKLTREQTLIVDALTGIDAAYHSRWRTNPTYTKGGKIDDFSEWMLKLVYFGELCEKFKSLACNIILITHESEKRDKDGTYSGKIRPLINGAFADKIVSHFTDWFRMQCSNKFTEDELTQNEAKIKQAWGMDKREMLLMQSEFPRNTIYYLQTEGDNIFDGKCSSLVNFPRYIPAHYKYFCKYMRKTSQ